MPIQQLAGLRTGTRLASYSYITSLDTKEDALEVVGGKGRSLAKLANAGFPVPGGFQVTTAAYRSFVADHELQARIVALARPAVVDGRASFEQSSAAIGAVVCRHRDLGRDQCRNVATGMAPWRAAPWRANPRWRCARRRTPKTCRVSPSPASRRRFSTSPAPRPWWLPSRTAGPRYGPRRPSVTGTRTASPRTPWPWPWSPRSWCPQRCRASCLPPTLLPVNGVR